MKQRAIKILSAVFVVCLVGLALALTVPVIWSVLPSARPALAFLAGYGELVPALIVGLVGSGVWCKALESRESGG